MYDEQKERLTDAELYALLDRLCPTGCAGADVLAEIAPDGWEQSPLLACFHPSVERVFEERLMMHRNLEELRRIRVSKHGQTDPGDVPRPLSTLEDVRREYEPQPVEQDEELTELMGSCLWDIVSDNHDVIMQDGRVADIGSFRGASAFLDAYVSGERNTWREGDHMRFYMGSIFLRGRADLTPVYALMFRRLKALGGDWAYHFPEIYLTEFGKHDAHDEQETYSVSQGAIAEVKAQKNQVEIARCRDELREMNARAREEALDRPPPATARAYRAVYGHDPRGWPPA